MDTPQIEKLLYEEEGTSLDFKREQYAFSGSSDEEKSELLKDILVFANAWRRDTAYILIGVEEVKGGRSRPVGIGEDLEDASLQQFVNSKTNQPITFSYRTREIDGVTVGIIQIPVQTRPFYIHKDYGRLSKNTVYVRRGSSTDVAPPNEVAKMGAADAGQAAEPPELQVRFADPESRESQGASLEVESIHYDPVVSAKRLKELDRPDPVSPFGTPMHDLTNNNSNFHEDFVRWITALHLLNRVAFVLTNYSSTSAEDVRVVLEASTQAGLHIIDEDDEPDVPERSFICGLRTSVASVVGVRPAVSKIGDRYEIQFGLDRIRPKETICTDGYFLIGAESSRHMRLTGKVFASNLPEPTPIELHLSISTNVTPMSEEHLFELLERFDNPDG